MREIPFKRPELEDRELLHSYFTKYPSRSCEKTFANAYLWSRHYKVVYAIIENTLVFKSENQGLAFTYPLGEPEDVKRAIEFLNAYSQEQGASFQLYHVTESQFVQLDEWYPGRFEMWRIMCMNQKSLPLYLGKNCMERGIILTNLNLRLRIGVMKH